MKVEAGRLQDGPRQAISMFKRAVTMTITTEDSKKYNIARKFLEVEE